MNGATRNPPSPPATAPFAVPDHAARRQSLAPVGSAGLGNLRPGQRCVAVTRPTADPNTAPHVAPQRYGSRSLAVIRWSRSDRNAMPNTNAAPAAPPINMLRVG